MDTTKIILILSLLCGFTTAKFDIKQLKNIQPRKVITTSEIIEKYGYQPESHKITTEDGYILALDRIITNASNNNVDETKIPVLLMHGLGGSSAMFVDLGPGKSLGFILADLGYDVWMGNARGNSYSNEHTTINRTEDPKAFYNFSWHEVGTIDLPANIDCILQQTGQDKLHYMGHSQGGTIFYVMASSKPEYNDKIRLASLMGPAGIMQNSPDPFLRIIVEFIEILELVPDIIGLYNIPLVELITTVTPVLCAQEEFVDLCVFIYNVIAGYPDDEQMDKSMFPIILQTTPSDAALKQLLHYGQGIKSGIFRQYDYGVEENLNRYGNETPPEYDLSAISAPVALYYGKNDHLVSPLDVQELSKRIQNFVHDGEVPHELFNHGDFLYAIDVVKLLYNDVIEVMSKY